MDELAGKSSEYFQAKNQIENLYDQMIRGRLRTAGCGIENNLPVGQNYIYIYQATVVQAIVALSTRYSKWIYSADKYLGKQKHYPLDRDFSAEVEFDQLGPVMIQ